MKRGSPLLFLQILCHLSVIPMLIHGTSAQFAISLVVFFFTGCIGMSMTFHRLLAHRSWEPPRGFEAFGTLCATVGLTGTSIAWAAVHRAHHFEVDTEKDPHSPYFRGIFWTQFLSMNYRPSMRPVRDLVRSPLHKFIHRYYLLIQLAYAGLLAVFAGPFAIVYAYLFPAAVLWNSGSLVNSIGHLWGYKNFPTRDESRNNPLLALVTWGEGWHNNHHRNQKKAYFGHRWYEVDIAGVLIQILKKRRRRRESSALTA